MCKFLFSIAFLGLAAIAARAVSSPETPLLINQVSLNRTQIAFTYAGKIWLVDRAGGSARRLTATPHEESNPVFSPDGRRLAFSRLNGGHWDVYVAPADGAGEARRLTLMPENDFVVAWTPDGREVVFNTTRDEETVFRLYKIDAEAPALAEALPLPQGFEASFSPDGRQIAYNPRVWRFGEWRHYRGGMTAPLWVTDLATGATEKLTAGDVNDRAPMWVGDRIYFLSDRTGTYNLYVHDRKTKRARRLTSFDGQGVRDAAATSDALVLVRDGRLHLFEPATGQTRAVAFTVAPETAETEPRTTAAVRFLEQLSPAADGRRIVAGARGEVLVADARTGEYRNLTATPGVAERYPALAPDGRSVAYFSDEDGEYALHVRPLDGGAPRKFAIEAKPSFYFNLSWSPDSRKLVFADRRLNLRLVDLASGASTIVDTSDYSAQFDWSTSFSPDSRYLVYAKRLPNRAGAVFVRDLAAARSYRVTDGVTHAEAPVFDAGGKYLYFVSSPNALTSEFDWGVLNGVFARPLVVRRLHAVLLARDAPAPLLPNRRPNEQARVTERAPQTRIDFDGLGGRVVDLPLPPRDYARLASGKPGQLLLAVNEWGQTPGDFAAPPAVALYLSDLGQAGEMRKVAEGVGGYELAAGGAHLLYARGRDWFLVRTEEPAKPGDGRLDLAKMEIRVDPRREVAQIFRESRRLMRDWFYDPNHHGQNLAALEDHYAQYLPSITRRRDLNALMSRMLGSVSVSHFNVGGGDIPPAAGGDGGQTGLLGADYAVENGRYRFRKIYRTTLYSSPAGSFRAPLDQPGVDVREGDYLLRVNGQMVDATKNVVGYFADTVGKPTELVVAATADGANARTVTVYPAAGENRLRRANWAEQNRRLVEKLSGGRLGYIFVEDYGTEGIMNAVRGLAGYADRPGVIVDQRFNGGGITPDYLIEWMQRKPLYYYLFREGADLATPVNPAPPVKVMLVNEWNGSAAETGAMMFRLGRLGPLVGKRTSGGGIGPYYFTPRFVDGGRAQLPNRAAYLPDGSSWGIENAGVAPDFDVEIMPADFRAGRDPQLEKAVEVALRRIALTPAVKPRRPAFPVHPGRQ